MTNMTLVALWNGSLLWQALQYLHSWHILYWGYGWYICYVPSSKSSRVQANLTSWFAITNCHRSECKTKFPFLYERACHNISNIASIYLLPIWAFFSIPWMLSNSDYNHVLHVHLRLFKMESATICCKSLFCVFPLIDVPMNPEANPYHKLNKPSRN